MSFDFNDVTKLTLVSGEMQSSEVSCLNEDYRGGSAAKF
ncbi:hypothetical protein PI124_g20948 [Phytophthora idaei]|nr:hypothetical protein PI125_g22626 [Phytophthora idaei]KAG3129645.1 hypothetical protein PI126_g20866 [Phytophthora idaei]KAG3233999.1 hypothetical protein PI124_g20948 [Phytophthora idaei]